jgi:hypothetical protein
MAKESHTQRLIVQLQNFYDNQPFAPAIDSMQPPINYVHPDIGVAIDGANPEICSSFAKVLDKWKFEGKHFVIGEGKSELCRQLTKLWARKEALFFDVVMYVPLTYQRWKKPPSEELLARQHIDLREWIEEYWRCNTRVEASLDLNLDVLVKQHTVAWIFDGFDDPKAIKISANGILDYLAKSEFTNILLTVKDPISVRGFVKDATFWEIQGLRDRKRQESFIIRFLRAYTGKKVEAEASKNVLKWINDSRLELIAHSPRMLRLLCIAHQMHDQQVRYGVVHEPPLDNTSQVLGWVFRCLLYNKDPSPSVIETRWQYLVDLAYELREGHGNVNIEHWVWECGFIGRNGGWANNLIRFYFAAAYIAQHPMSNEMKTELSRKSPDDRALVRLLYSGLRRSDERPPMEQMIWEDLSEGK